MDIILQNEDAYGHLIRNYFQTEFPLTFPTTKADILEILTSVLIGTKETRYGPTPSPETLVRVRQVLRDSIEVDAPIPILAAWGGRKTDPYAKVDVSELRAIRGLICLDQKIRQFYPSGINLNIRIEDTGAYLLYRNDMVDDLIDRYSKDFLKLVNILRGTSRINPILESDLMPTQEYIKRSLSLSNLIEQYITESDEAPQMVGRGEKFEILRGLGWTGEIPYSQREFYRSRYKAIYPDVTSEVATKYLSDYLAGAKIRYEMHGRAEPAKEFIGLSFVQPIPGAPESMFGNTIYYRTLPLSEAKSHMPAWRAKGYLKIAEDNSVKTKIISFQDRETISQLHHNVVTLTSGATSVEVQADYLLS